MICRVLPRSMSTTRSAGSGETSGAANLKAGAPLAAPPTVGTLIDEALDDIVIRADGMKPQPVKQDPPRRPEGRAPACLPASPVALQNSSAISSRCCPPPPPRQDAPARPGRAMQTRDLIPM